MLLVKSDLRSSGLVSKVAVVGMFFSCLGVIPCAFVHVNLLAVISWGFILFGVDWEGATCLYTALHAYVDVHLPYYRPRPSSYTYSVPAPTPPAVLA